MTESDRDALRQALIRDEGLRLKPYKDSVGVLTIGVGRNLEDRGITEATARAMLDEDITTHAAELERALPWVRTLDPVRYRVLVNMAFNLGVAGLKRFTRTLGHVQRGEFPQAADAMLKSLWAKQVGKRAQRLAEEMRTGVEAR